MLTFNEFLEQFKEEVEEVFVSTEMSDNAKKAVVEVMGDYLRGRRFDPTELLALFERVCIMSMNKSEQNEKELSERIIDEAPKYLTEQPDYSKEPDITFEEISERRTIGR